ncbi:response regulator transcription factor [Oricola thermophila]|uniref:Response regulator transcription factor n=1 Tax=Oricola thermophila TaxID=2742145 RepID=A0A6N1V7R4_9HYPH|nr:response regulator transcription factor [Oricola thermophila]QKV16996.1 response regulator transcription factor [Oricola thermophila]
MSREQPLVAIIEDDAEIGEILIAILSDSGFRTRHFFSAAEFEASLAETRPEICLVDLGLPGENGLDLVKRLDSCPEIGTIIISGRRGLTDKIVGLEMGADDYIAKPFEPAEIVARIRSVLRRARRNAPTATQTNDKTKARFDGWTVDLSSYTLQAADNRTIPLSQAEMDVLKVFLSAPNRLFTRAQIMDRIATDPDGHFDRSIDVRISRLRTKFGEDPQNPKIIKTVYGAGYIFVANVKWT